MRLAEGLNAGDLLAALSGSLGDSTVKRIRKCRGDRTSEILDTIERRRMFEDFFRALAGLNPDLFKLITGRDPTKEEIGRARMAVPRSLTHSRFL